MERCQPSRADHHSLRLRAPAGEALFLLDPDGFFRWVSPAAERVAGWRPADLIGHYVGDVVRSFTADELAEIESHLWEGSVVEVVVPVRRSDGRSWWADVQTVPVFSADGELEGAVGCIDSGSDASVAWAAVAESEAHFRLIAENASDIVVKITPDYVVDWVSPSVTTVLGWHPSEVVGVDVRQFVHPDDVALTAHRGLIAGEPGRPVPPRDGFVLRIRAADGTYRWMSSRPRYVFDDTGREVATISNWSDVQELVEARASAEHDRELVKATFESLVEPHVLFEPLRDPSGEIIDFVYVDANTAALNDNKMSRDEMIGARLTHIAARKDSVPLVQRLIDVLTTGEPMVVDDLVFGSIGMGFTDRHYDLRAVRVLDKVSVTWRDITDRHDFEARLSHLAVHDPLTGLANRAGMLEELHRALAASRRSNLPTAVLMLDVDWFKSVNDTHGHVVGDQLLLEAADRLQHAVREGDLVARPGGDEFVVIMRDLTDPSEAVRVGQRVVEAFRRRMQVGGHELLTTVSLGVSVSDSDSTADDLIRQADASLYLAKENGRDRFVVFGESLKTSAEARASLERELRPALGLGELVMFFQPEVDLASGEVRGAEALLRWHHPSGELLVADRFIDLAEENGLMIDIGRWVVREACRAASRWSVQSSGRLRTMYLNLSRAQLADPGLSDDLRHALEASGTPPSVLCVEISEKSLARLGGAATANLKSLSELGVRVAIDDFGSGEASIAILRDHRIDAIKIDRSFVGNVGRDDHSTALMAGIVALARTMDLDVVAEGVESTQQAQFVRDIGCSSAHGYLYSQALPMEEFTALLQRT